MRIDRNGQALNDGDQKIALSSNKINKEGIRTFIKLIF